MSDSDSKVIPFPKKPSARAWKAAEQSLGNYGWVTWTNPVDLDIRRDLRSLRSRAREQAQNNDLVRGYLLDVKNNVVGNTGIKLQSRVKLKNGKADKKTNDQIEEAWTIWGKKGNCDVTGQLSWRAMQSLLLETAAKDGEFFLRIVEGWKYNEFGFALQVIDPEAIDVDYNEELPGGNIIRMGVELNEWRRPVAYWITDEPKNAYSHSYQTGEKKRVRVPADQIIHGFLQEWCWQTRGVPWLATSIRTLKTEDGYNEAAITAARAAASKMAFYTREQGSDGPGMDGERNAQGDLIKDAVPGGMEELPAGYQVTTVDWAWPNADHGDFLVPMWRRLATGLGVNYNTWANDYGGVNFSSLRKGALKERDVWKTLQAWLIETLHERVHSLWLSSSMLNGALLRPTGVPFDIEELPRLQRSAWQARGWQWVDPQKEETANQTAFENRTRSLSDIIRDRGQDPDEVWGEIASDMEKLKELGIDIQPKAKQKTQVTDDDEEEPDSEDKSKDD